MRFSRKVFLALFFSIAVAGTAITWGTYNYVSGQTRDAFVARYTVFSKVLGDTLTRLDKNTESLMLNAAQVVDAHDAEKGLLSNSQLKVIRDKVNVTHIFIVDKNGKFIRSTNEDAALIPNAFSFCPAYKNMIVGTTASDATPVIKPRPEPKPYKFLFIPNRNRQRLLEVGVRVDFVAKTLSEALGSDANVLSMSLYDPNGTNFGSFTAKEYNYTEGITALPASVPWVIEQKDHFKFYTKVTSSHPVCCQCDVSKTSKNGEYYYVLESVISKKELAIVLANTKFWFIFFGITIVFVSLAFAQFLFKRLVYNLELAARRVKEIGVGAEPGQRINLDGSDEVSFLTNHFDKLLDKIESNQARVLEAEKIEAKVQLASEVAHNIKSPIIAIEMTLRMLPKVPENVQNVLKNSVKEIKALAESLKNHADSLSGHVSQENELIFLPIFIQEFISQKTYEFAQRQAVSFKYYSNNLSNSAYVKLRSVELRSVLSNIVNNAVDAYGAHGGQVVVELEATNQSCIVRVHDLGAGIPQEYLQSLGAKKITFKGGGSHGVGLVHAFKLVETWGGKISLSSQVGSGTTVELTLPKYDASAHENLGAPSQSVTI